MLNKTSLHATAEVRKLRINGRALSFRARVVRPADVEVETNGHRSCNTTGTGYVATKDPVRAGSAPSRGASPPAEASYRRGVQSLKLGGWRLPRLADQGIALVDFSRRFGRRIEFKC